MAAGVPRARARARRGGRRRHAGQGAWVLVNNGGKKHGGGQARVGVAAFA